MASKCGKCFSELKQGDLNIKCIDCTTEFHPACTQLGTQNFTKAKSKNWKCESCVVETGSTSSQRSHDSSTAAVDKKTLIEALNSFKTDLKSHTDSAVGNVITKLDSLTEEVQALNDKLNSLDQNQTALQNRCDTLEQANTALTTEVRSLRARLNDAEQHSRCANIEVLGIPVTTGENVYVILEKLAATLGTNFKREDVSIAHRLRLFSEKQPHPPIICQFVSRTVKEKWLAAARTKRNLKSTDISANLQLCNIYVNDHLTGNSKGLLGRARRLQREGKIHFAGYFNGKILVKPRERDAAIRIVHQEDLDKFDSN